MTDLNNLYSERDSIFKARELNLEQQRKSLQHLLDTIDARQDKLYEEKKELDEFKKELDIKERILNDGIKEEKIAREDFDKKVSAFKKEKAAFDKDHTLELEKLHNESLSMELLKNNYEDKIQVLELIIKKDKDGNVDHEIIDSLLGGYSEKVNNDKELHAKLEYLEEYKFKLEKNNDVLQEKITSLIEENKVLSESLENKNLELKKVSEDAHKALDDNTTLIHENENLKVELEKYEENNSVLMQKIVTLSSESYTEESNESKNINDNEQEEISDELERKELTQEEVTVEDDFIEVEETATEMQNISFATECKNFINENCLDFENVVLEQHENEEILSFSSKGVNVKIYFSEKPKFEVFVKRENNRRLKKLLKMKTEASNGKIMYKYENNAVYATSYFSDDTKAAVLINNVRSVRQEFE